ncbi:hypothetical protein C2S52_002365 [Perilla frutescens var. hirtella]|nr:hypothetical protein C2S52_002365 [Perilla frutescens var. hirtella]
MRNQWLRLLLLRCHTPSQPHISQVHHLRSFTSSLLHARAPHAIANPFPLRRRFTSSPELAVEPPKPPTDPAVLVADIFSKPEMSNDEIKTDLDVKNVIMTHDLILSVLKIPDINPDVAKRVFNWVLESESAMLSSKSYNMMLGILGGSGFVKEAWELIEIMKKKGYGVKKGAHVRISERFLKDGFSDDVEKLKDLYASGSASQVKNDAGGGISVVSDCLRVAEIIGKEVWGDDVEKQLKELDVEFTSDLVTGVLDNLEMDPNKALIFFRWVEDSSVFDHDKQSYNALARVLGTEDHSHKFWRVIDEMRSGGHLMERKTYNHLFEQFLEKKMITDAVDLYEFAMSGGNKPSVKDCTLLLKKIVVSDELYIDLFQKVVGLFKANGNELTDNILNAVIKSLTSVGRMNECNRILAVMKEAGYIPSGSLQRKIAYKLSSFGETAEALEFMDKMVPSSDYTTWISLVHGFCEQQNLDGAYSGVRKMVGELGASCGGRPLDLLVGTYCQKDRALRAYKIVSKLVNEKGVRPWHSTYKTLTRGLLARKHFEEALDIMSMMKNQGYPPDLDSFVAYLSKKGTAEDAITFTRGVSSKRYAATPVFLRLFEAYLSAGKQSEAHDLLSECPRHIKNDAGVLDLFASKAASAATKAADVAV